MFKAIRFVVIFVTAVTFFLEGAFAAENTHKVPFSVKSVLKTECPNPNESTLTNKSKELKIKVTFVCTGVESDGQKGHMVWYLLVEEQNTPKFIEIMLDVFSRGDKQFGYSFVEQDKFGLYEGLTLKEVLLSSGEKVQFPYERLPVASGEIAEVYYITLFINKKVYRHHALVRLSTSPKLPVLWIVFTNQRYTKYKGVDKGKNDPVLTMVRSTLAGLRFSK